MRAWYIPALLATTVSLVCPALAGPDEDAIRQRFDDWTQAFNTRDVGGVCDLFAPDLVYSLPEVTNGTRETMCANLAKILSKPNVQLSYQKPDIHEILVSGPLAVVRLTWTLTVKAEDKTETTAEEGIDIFRKQSDGRWSIARFIAFTTTPNNLVP